jgi:hypothetical protein
VCSPLQLSPPASSLPAGHHPAAAAIASLTPAAGQQSSHPSHPLASLPACAAGTEQTSGPVTSCRCCLRARACMHTYVCMACTGTALCTLPGSCRSGQVGMPLVMHGCLDGRWHAARQRRRRSHSPSAFAAAASTAAPDRIFCFLAPFESKIYVWTPRNFIYTFGPKVGAEVTQLGATGCGAELRDVAVPRGT